LNRTWPILLKPAAWSAAAGITVWMMAVTAAGGGSAADTSLLFVGEDLSVLTIASRRAETPEQAPAVAHVITREQMEQSGFRTLGEALSSLPGFHISRREWGSQPSLRGVADSVLFLYDSVPLTSDSTKSIHPLDEELSLGGVERIEVIRGPGSVLWGPDAFAGIVNIVPKRGRDIEGVEVLARGGSPHQEGAFTVNWGHNAGLWESFVSLSGTRLKPSPDRFNIQTLTEDGAVTPGLDHVDPAEYLELTFNMAWQDWLRLSGRWSDSQRPYVITSGGELAWEAKRDAPFRFLRMEVSRDLERTSLRLNAFYNELKREEQQIGLELEEKGRVWHVEALCDRELFGNQGLLTLGGSFRYNESEAVQSKSSLPDFLQPDNEYFSPLPAERESFESTLSSVFGQYRHHWGRMDGWIGLRYDNHSQYDETVSYNLGVGLPLAQAWHLKLLYGTAYRTPYDQQLVGTDELDAEEVQSLSAEISWRPKPGLQFQAVPFWNQIRHHIQENPVGGLSRPGRETLAGIELALRLRLTQTVQVWANGTFLSYNGDDESYKVLGYIYFEPDGTQVEVYENIAIPFDTAPKNLFNAGLVWTPSEKADLALRLNYAGTRNYDYIQRKVDAATSPLYMRVSGSSTPVWLFDAALTVHDMFLHKLDVQLAVKNIFDQKYTIPGIYSPIETDRLSAYVGLKWQF